MPVITHHNVTPEIARLRVNRIDAALTRMRVSSLRRRGAHRQADALEQIYFFFHGTRPAKHAFDLMVQDRLKSDRWRPQP